MTDNQNSPENVEIIDGIEVTHGEEIATDDTTTATDSGPEDNTAETDETREEIKRAVKFRRRAQEAEAERDELRSQLENIRRQVVEQASGLAVPASLWLVPDIDVNALFDADGRLIPALPR